MIPKETSLTRLPTQWTNCHLRRRQRMLQISLLPFLFYWTIRRHGKRQQRVCLEIATRVVNKPSSCPGSVAGPQSTGKIYFICLCTYNHGCGSKKIKCTLNFPFCNLFCCSSTQSIFSGVSWYKTARKWVAQISIDGKPTFLGYFESEGVNLRLHRIIFIEFFCY